jgi:hypothetical protein
VLNLIEEQLKEQARSAAASVEVALAGSRESLLAESGLRAEVMREEVLVAQRDLLAGLKRQVEARLQDTAASVRESR